MTARRLVPLLAGIMIAFSAAAVTAPPGPAAAADAGPTLTHVGRVPLPTGFDAIEVDGSGTGRVFVSSPTSNIVSVIAADGEMLGGIPVPGAGALLVDGPTIYVASTTGGRIDAFDTATLTKTGSYGGGGLLKPYGLVKAGGRLWTAMGGCDSDVQLVSIDPATGAVTVHPPVRELSYCPFLFSSPLRPFTILGFEIGISPTRVHRLDISTGAPVLAGSLWTENSNSQDGEVLPDGQTFALGSGFPNEVRTFTVDPLGPHGVLYPTQGAPVAIDATAAAGGLIAAGADAYNADDLRVFRLGDPSTTFLRHDFGSGPDRVWPRGLAFSADGTRLYAVTGETFFKKTATLQVFGPPYPGGRYHPLPPARILDTRDAGPAGRIGPGGTRDVQVTGQGGVPATGVSAVAMNVTVTQPTAASFLTVFPAGTAPPEASNLNFTPGKTVPNLVVAKVGAGGKVSMYNAAGSVDVVVDVAGWFSEPAAAGDDGRYTAVVPSRILDTRTAGVRLGPGASVDLQVAGRGGVPASGAKAAVLNVAATGATATSFLTVHPSGQARPLASTLNFDAGDTVSNRAIVELGAGGGVTAYNLAGSTDVVVDLVGWYNGSSAPAAGLYTALAPTRILDTRNGPLGPLAGGGAREVQVAGRAGLPPMGVSAVVVNATVVDPAGGGYVSLFASDIDVPVTFDVNYAGGETRPNLAIVSVGPDGKIGVHTSTTAHVVLDVAGWFSGP